MSETPQPHSDGPVAAIVVTYESESVIERCLAALRAAAPCRGIAIRVVDNASTDASAALAERALGAGAVSRLARNGGFAAGVNAGLQGVDAPWVAVLNPDTIVPAGALDRLADVLERHPRGGLVGPRVRDPRGRPERSVGLFPTMSRELVHAWLLDHLGWEGRWAPFPRATAAVDWVSGCAWLLRAEAVRKVGPLDEEYFMYVEDVDYCRRLHDAGWTVLATPEVEVVHALGVGSDATDLIPADGGAALVRYYAKFHPEVPPERIRTLLARGWRLRRAWRRVRAGLGDRKSAAVARRYELALEAIARP